MKHATLRTARAATLGALLFVALGCSAPHNWLEERILDASDIVDVKYGHAIGLGAKVEASLWLGAGLGLAELGPDVHEYYGRARLDKGAEGSEGVFMHLLAAGADTYSAHGGSPDSSSMNVLGLNVYALDSGEDPPPAYDRFRVGVEVIPLVAVLGVYVNLGQALDFLAGLTGFDPAGDDAFAKGVSMNVAMEDR